MDELRSNALRRDAVTFPDQPGRSASLLEWAPCRKCGGVDRRPHDGRCRTCANASSAIYRAANPEKVKAGIAAWQLAHKEQENARARQWHQDHKERARASRKAWLLTPEGRAFKRAKEAKRRVNELRATPAWLTPEQERAMRSWYRLAVATGLDVDHIEPLQGEDICGLHVPWNLRLLPQSDNAKKSNRIDRCERRTHNIRMRNR